VAHWNVPACLELQEAIGRLTGVDAMQVRTFFAIGLVFTLLELPGWPQP
jgi:hypothetical protein